MHLTNFHFYPYKNYLYSKPIKGLQGCWVGYGFGFNGEESINEMFLGAYDLGERFYDARLGKMLSLDPLMQKYPSWSPYSYSGNCPTSIVDINGEGPGPQDGTDKRTVKKGETLWSIAKSAYKTYKKDGESFASYWKNIQAWNKDVKYGDEGAQVNVEDPANKVKYDAAQKEFESNSEVKPSTTLHFFSYWGEDIKGNVNNTESDNGSYKKLLFSSIMGTEVANITGELLQSLMSDPKIKNLEQQIQNDFLKESKGTGFVYNQRSFMFGNDDRSKGVFELNAWVFRNCQLKYMVSVHGDMMTIKFRAEDLFDLRPSRAWKTIDDYAYNVTTAVLGTFYHGYMRGNANMQTRAAWKVDIKTKNKN